MALVYPSYVNIPSTPSTSSQSSLPPSSTISVHDHVLPPGWQCRYDPKSGRYYFLNDYISGWDSIKHGPQSSCQSSRSSSPSHTFTSYGRYFQPFSSRYKVSDYSSGLLGFGNFGTYQKIVQQFPQVEESYISHLMRTYHNRENLVISALLSEGFTRHFHPPADEALFYKLKTHFPTVESETIRQLLIKHNNVEHEVIAAIISNLGPSYARYQSTSTAAPGSPKMKLRYLKLIYPEVDEAVLFHLLYNCDQNAQEAIKRLDSMGYKRTEARPSIKPDLTDQKKIRPQTVTFAPRQLKFPPNIAEKQKIFKQIEEEFPNVNHIIINMALESSGFDVERAKIFLSAMTPQDSAKYFPKDMKPSVQPSPLLSRICRGTQTNSLLDSLIGTPIKTKRKTANKTTIGTSTTEDGIFVEEKKKSLAKGPNPNNRKGHNILNLIKSYLPWKGPDSKNRQGADPSKCKGPDPSLRKGSASIAKGPQASNRKGPLARLIKKKCYCA